MNSKSGTSLRLARYLLYVLYFPLWQVAKEF